MLNDFKLFNILKHLFNLISLSLGLSVSVKLKLFTITFTYIQIYIYITLLVFYDNTRFRVFRPKIDQY